MAIYSPIPNVPETQEGQTGYLLEEVQRIGQASSAPYDVIRFNKLEKLPSKIRDGDTVYMSAALATAQGLAAGAGPYMYIGSTWTPLHT